MEEPSKHVVKKVRGQGRHRVLNGGVDPSVQVISGMGMGQLKGAGREPGLWEQWPWGRWAVSAGGPVGKSQREAGPKTAKWLREPAWAGVCLQGAAVGWGRGGEAPGRPRSTLQLMLGGGAPRNCSRFAKTKPGTLS